MKRADKSRSTRNATSKASRRGSRANKFLCRANYDPTLRRSELLREQRSLVERGFVGYFGKPDDFDAWQVVLLAQSPSSWLPKPEHVFVLTRLEWLDYANWDNLVGKCFCLAQLHRRKKGSLGIGVVAIVDECDAQVIQEARAAKLSSQFGDLAGVPFSVIVETRTGTVHFFEKVPMLFGKAMFTSMKTQICNNLLPGPECDATETGTG